MTIEVTARIPGRAGVAKSAVRSSPLRGRVGPARGAAVAGRAISEPLPPRPTPQSGRAYSRARDLRARATGGAALRGRPAHRGGDRVDGRGARGDRGG